MSEKTLPSNWHITNRPRTFDDVYGNDLIKRYFKQLIKNKKEWDRAYLFAGDPGSGKTTFAKIIAKYLSCNELKSDGSPCDACLDCRAIDEERWTRDAILLDGNDKEKMSASEARAYVSKFCSFAATRGRNKVMIIDEAGKLSKEAISAFLKPLENPMDGYYFIFTTMEAMGKDVSSSALQRRCKQFKLATPKAETVYLFLAKVATDLGLTKDEKIPKDFWTSGLEFISRTCNFSYGKAISRLEQCVTGWIFDPKEMSGLIDVVDEENLNVALDDICNGRITKAVKDTLLDPSDYTETFNFAFYRLVQGKIALAFGRGEDDDWRMAVAEKLAKTPYFNVVIGHFNALSDASTQYLRKNRYQEMIADLVIEIRGTSRPSGLNSNSTEAPRRRALKG
jgi:DNA polymerase III gamma/tau subunit